MHYTRTEVTGSMGFVYGPVSRNLQETLSADRLSPYLVETLSDIEKALQLYVWNVALSSAFYGPLGVLEIVLRNAIHRELSIAFGPQWHDAHGFLGIDARFNAAVARAKGHVAANRRPMTTPRLVAALSFGFWVNLLRPDYMRSLWWPCIHRAFPAGSKRSAVLGMFEPLQKFRNRVAHHEPIFHKNPHAQYQNLLLSLRILAPRIAPWVAHHSTVPQILKRSPTDGSSQTF